MIKLNFLRKKFRKSFKSGQKSLVEFGVNTEKGFEKYLLKRLGRLESVSRFVFAWVALLVLLIGGVLAQNILLSKYYQTIQPVPGGIYKEGMLSTFTNANPLYASSEADQIVSRLVFSGLMTYDKKGNIVGDLAEGYALEGNNTYVFKLKPNLKWHDGKPVTSEDVVFTFNTIQNPDIQSPLRNSYQGVSVTAPDAKTVVIKLPTPLSSFIYNLTTGIIPKHILGNVPSAEFRSTDFNTINPVGAGPFKMSAVEVSGKSFEDRQQRIALIAFEDFHTPVKLNEIVVKTFAKEEDLVEAFKTKDIMAVSGLDSVPKDLEDDKDVIDHSYMLRAANMVFFKVSAGVLADKNVRLALVRASDTDSIIKSLNYQTLPVTQPFLQSHATFSPQFSQAKYNLEAAKTALTSAGWVEGGNGVRAKAGTPLKFDLSVHDTPENRKVSKMLQEQWKKIGAEVKINYLSTEDFQLNVSSHNYEAVLHNISIGSDPDVFVYWESTQADVRSAYRLNLSEYKDSAADAALLAGRSRVDTASRIAKYRPFLQAWQRDAPALGLYQPRFLYITRGPVDGLPEGSITSRVDRISNAHNWQIRQAKVTNSNIE